VSVQDLTFTKYIDAATPNLIKFCCNGKHFKEATLTVRKAGGSSIDYLTIKLSTVLISSVQTGATSSDDRITENVTLNFAKFDLEYKPQTSGGSAGAGSSISWNIASNAEK
jgi:type VI secretion system secreted protein Hcp